jgi:hypothetical protein
LFEWLLCFRLSVGVAWLMVVTLHSLAYKLGRYLVGHAKLGACGDKDVWKGSNTATLHLKTKAKDGGKGSKAR